MNNDCRSEISSGSGYWDGADQNCSSVSLKLWWENLAESDCEGRLVSAVEGDEILKNYPFVEKKTVMGRLETFIGNIKIVSKLHISGRDHHPIDS